MASMSKQHQELDSTGVGKCSKPMWWGDGSPAGFCDEPAYGPQETNKHVYVPGLACPRHGGPVKAKETQP